eukprot:TRINITY_DN6450_c0_g1_i3.p1 TRINITY_DN6450_c0_g1~~TRINITY_DN6450_c0_g1_i3.p1  ORF type:complete len:473 (+),score=121.21 TRINITY_DN6450_c0_g1_i3:1684-3102(+)
MRLLIVLLWLNDWRCVVNMGRDRTIKSLMATINESDFPPLSSLSEPRQQSTLFPPHCYITPGFKKGEEVALYKDVWIIIFKHAFGDYDNPMATQWKNIWKTLRLVCKGWSIWVNQVYQVNYDAPLVASIQSGRTEAVKFFLTKGREHLTLGGMEKAFLVACVKGMVWAVDLLVREHSVDPSIRGNTGLALACIKGRKGLVQYLLRDKRVGPSHQSQRTSLTWYDLKADEAFILDFVKKGLGEEWNTFQNWGIPFDLSQVSWWGSNPDVIELLLKDPRMDPSECNNLLLNTLISFHQYSSADKDLAVSHLIKDGRIQFDKWTVCGRNAEMSFEAYVKSEGFQLSDEVIKRCCARGLVNHIKIIVSNVEITNEIFAKLVLGLVGNNDEEILDILFEIPGIDLAFRDNYLIAHALNANLIKRLLEYPNVNPKARGFRVMKIAKRRKDKESINLLRDHYNKKKESNKNDRDSWEDV